LQCRIPNDPWFQESGGLGKPGNTVYWNNDPELPKPWSESLDSTFSMLMGAKWSRDLLEAGHCLPINPVLGARIKIVLGKYKNGDDKNKDLIESIIWSAKREIILPVIKLRADAGPYRIFKQVLIPGDAGYKYTRQCPRAFTPG
jgi:hypothetical protein